MHPLTPNLTELSLDDLNTKYNELSKRAMQCQRMGSNSMLIQISMVLDDYRNEIARRQQKIYEEANSKHDFNSIININ
jgi:hypothetical protein